MLMFLQQAKWKSVICFIAKMLYDVLGVITSTYLRPNTVVHKICTEDLRLVAGTCEKWNRIGCDTLLNYY